MWGRKKLHKFAKIRLAFTVVWHCLGC
jgi:hypothetical protein